jgi:hypothetical protein
MNNQEKLTQNEYDAFLGLSHFLLADQANNDLKPDAYAVESFCFNANDLLSGLYRMVAGRFKCDGGLTDLADVFKEAATLHPHMAPKYFYIYSQLMEMLVAIYNAEPFIRHYLEVFYELSEKVEYFERPRTIPQQSTQTV